MDEFEVAAGCGPSSRCPLYESSNFKHNLIPYRDDRVQTKVFWANFEGSYLNEFGSVDPLRWRVFQSPLNNT